LRTAHTNGRTLPTILYSVGFVLQVAGAILVVLEIRNDVRTARQVSSTVTWDNIDSFPRFVRERLSGHLGLRILGVVLIFVGATVEFAANLTAVA
jgi:hypothetical protein